MKKPLLSLLLPATGLLIFSGTTVAQTTMNMAIREGGGPSRASA